MACSILKFSARCRLREITGLTSRASQACFLVSLLISRQLPRLTSLLEEAWCKKVASLSLKDVVCSKDGEDAMTQLISVLLDEHQASPGTWPTRSTHSHAFDLV